MHETSVTDWLKASGVRALKTAAQAAIIAIGSGTTMGAIDWRLVVSSAAAGAILSLLTSTAGIPEVGEGANVVEIARGGREDEGK